MPERGAVASALQAAPAVAVMAHIHPEGDAIGSLLGAVLALTAAGKVARGYLADPLPPALTRLPGARELVREVPIGTPYPCYLVLDTSDLERVGGLLEGRPPTAMVLNVDHHPGNSRFGDLNWVDPAASSAGEMVYGLLRQGGFPVTAAVATNLFAAILTDTGSFHHANTTPRALQAAAELVAAGAAPARVAGWLFGERDPREWRLLSQALAGLQLSGDGRVAWLEVSLAAQAHAGVGLEVTEEFIQYARAVAGVQVAVAFKEVGAAEVKVSFRSREGVDVRVVAERFGGGGHRSAAGCTLRVGLAEARGLVLPAVADHLGPAPGGADPGPGRG